MFALEKCHFFGISHVENQNKPIRKFSKQVLSFCNIFSKYLSGMNLIGHLSTL